MRSFDAIEPIMVNDLNGYINHRSIIELRAL